MNGGARFQVGDVRARIGELDQLRRRLTLGIGTGTDVTLGDGVVVSKPKLLRLGEGVELRSHARVRGAVSIGSHSRIHEYALLDARNGRIEIGSNCSVGDYSVLYGDASLVIGNDTIVEAHVVVLGSDRRADAADVPIRAQGVNAKPVVIGQDVCIGPNVSVLAGVEIGRGSVIGAGSVVTDSVPPFSVVGGNPARVVRRRGAQD